MTLFDSIRYPIGSPPTGEQFDAVPVELYNRWIRGLSKYDYLIGLSCTDLARFYHERHWTDNSLEELRKIILEHDTE